MRWLLGCDERLSVLRLFGWERILFVLVVGLFVWMWTTSTKVLVASSQLEGGHVLSCRYFTGKGLMQWQYGGAAARDGCPMFKVG